MTLGLVHMTYFEYLERNFEVAKVLVQQIFISTLSKNGCEGVRECVCIISMDAGLREELNSIIEKLTHSGLPSLNQDLLKKLKRLCKYVWSKWSPYTDTIMLSL